MPQDKFCPMAMNGPENEPLPRCIEEGCAWYDGEACAALVLAVMLRRMEGDGIRVRSMPSDYYEG